MNYDGGGKLGEAIASLCGLSPKSQAQIAERIKQAKDTLGITSKAKNLPDDVKLSIWQWHYDRLQSTANEAVNILSQLDSNEAVETFSQDNIQSVNIISQSDGGGTVELYSHGEHQEGVEIISQIARPDTVNIFSQPDSNEAVNIISQPTGNEAVNIFSQYDDMAIVRVAFYTINHGVKTRQVIALDGFYINALMLATGIAKADVPKWVQQAVDGWAAFDSASPITRQVKLLLVRELTGRLAWLKGHLNEH